MFRAAAIALGAFILVGCSANTQVKNPFKSDDTQKTQLAAFAAQSQYPTKQPSDAPPEPRPVRPAPTHPWRRPFLRRRSA